MVRAYHLQKILEKKLKQKDGKNSVTLKSAVASATKGNTNNTDEISDTVKSVSKVENNVISVNISGESSDETKNDESTLVVATQNNVETLNNENLQEINTETKTDSDSENRNDAPPADVDPENSQNPENNDQSIIVVINNEPNVENVENAGENSGESNVDNNGNVDENKPTESVE
jgi:hypothetical protein